MKIIKILLFITIVVVYSFSETSIIIIPPFNISANKELDYISKEIQVSLTNKLTSYNYFNIYDWEDAEYIFYTNNFDYNRLIFEDDQQRIKELTGINISIVGFYKITNDYIHIYLKCFEKKDKVESFTFEYIIDYNEKIIKEAIEYSTKQMTEMIINKYKNKSIVKNRIVNLTRENKNKMAIQRRNISGYVLTATGALISIGGIISFAIDISENYNKEKEKFSDYINKKIDNEEYNQFNKMYLAFTISSLSLTTVGLSTMFIGLPMFLYSNRDLNTKNKIGFGIYASGTSLFSLGLSFILFDVLCFYSYVRNNILLYNKKMIEYSEYENFYNQNIVLFTLGLTFSATGILMTIISIPFLINREKEIQKYKKMSKNKIEIFITSGNETRFGMIVKL